MHAITKCLSSSLCRRINGVPSLLSNVRHNSSENELEKDVKVGITGDNMTFVCWHPELPFPYKYSKPLPRRRAEIEEGDSPLKVQHLLAEKLSLRPEGPTDNELANIFFTSKHPWYPKPQKKYKKPVEPKDRDKL
ncbi:39S ribosomal protein L42, mitochondrial-like isoform X1 [Argonauta hians]